MKLGYQPNYISKPFIYGVWVHAKKSNEKSKKIKSNAIIPR